jgi:hypothetical protein
MKRCPTCKTTYTDDGLRFCLADGATLAPLPDEEPTVFAGRRDNLRIDIPHEDQPRYQTPLPAATGSSGRWIKILLGILLLGFLGIVIAGGAGFFFYYNSGRGDGNIVLKTPTPTPSPVPSITPDPEKQQLKDELANIQKRLDEQKKANVNTQPPRPPDQPPATTATANSPEDGFLALRSKPNSETGARITKIPHGARILIGTCGQYITTARNNYGRWCTASYNGYTGWVFDAFVKY